MSKPTLGEILEKYEFMELTEEAHEAIKTAIEAVIGEDEYVGKPGYSAQPVRSGTVGEQQMIVRNVFRAEQRKRLKAFLGEE